LLSTCVSYISINGPGPGADRSGLVTGFYTDCYIMGIFVTGFPNEACYSLISVCNELSLTPVTDTAATTTVTYLVTCRILEPTKI
jgi:hypothetical protein